jgi:DNA-directed RNA polymerase II subunit RPB1
MLVLAFLLVFAAQQTVNYWLLQHGMSIGIGDTVADPTTMATINAIIEKAKDDVKAIINTYQSGELEQQPGRTMQESFEVLCENALVIGPVRG